MTSVQSTVAFRALSLILQASEVRRIARACLFIVGHVAGLTRVDLGQTVVSSVVVLATGTRLARNISENSS